MRILSNSGLLSIFKVRIAAEFTFETDCWDVHDALERGPDFVLLDVRSAALYAKGHVPGAIHLAHGKLVQSKLAEWPADTLFVTYCASLHCNGAARGALRMTRLGRPVKIMAGGISGWLDEGFELAKLPICPSLSLCAHPSWAARISAVTGLSASPSAARSACKPRSGCQPFP